MSAAGTTVDTPSALIASAGAVASAPAAESRAYFSPDLVQRRMFFDFLDLSYKGGVNYKFGVDATGQPILIAHEGETEVVPPAGAEGGVWDPAKLTTSETIVGSRYSRRRRTSAYENHVQPIQDKVRAYLTSQEPKRQEAKQDEFDRVEISEHIDEMIADGLKLTEAWVGYDSAAIPIDANVSVAQAAQIDPEHQGKPFIVRMDPRCVVDCDPPHGCEVERVVFEYQVTTKAGFTSQPETKIYYKEWTATEWVLYERVSKEGDGTTNLAGGQAVREIKRQAHAFGECPWRRFSPRFPTSDLCELNRALFNITSLLDEELYSSTFTQRYVTGEKPDQVRKMKMGSGNTMVFPNPDTTFGVLGAIPGQAQSLMDRATALRDAIYALVNMENSATKNVAESAEKKKRDLEALYTMLVGIIGEVEEVENWLLAGMKIIDPTQGDAATRYSREFDVLSLQDILDEITKLGKVPFAPSMLKRSMAERVAQKMDPFGDHAAFRKAIAETFDSTPDMAGAMADLKREGLLTPEMFVSATGLPPAMLPGLQEAVDTHANAAAIDPNAGDPNAAGNQDAGGGDTGGPGGAPADSPAPGTPSGSGAAGG